MKKLHTLIIALFCLLTLVGCQKTTTGAKLYSFPDTAELTGTLYSQGKATGFELSLEDSRSVVQWFDSLELTPCNEPEPVEGAECYDFDVDGNTAFTYENRGREAYIIIGSKYYQLKETTTPPINLG